MQIARVVIVRVIVDGVLGVTVDVLIGHDEVLVNVVIYVAIFVVIFCNWRCTLYTERVNHPDLAARNQFRASERLARARLCFELSSSRPGMGFAAIL